MTPSALAFFGASAVYLGFQATIRFLVYPQFRTASGGSFTTYAAEHSRRVSLIVGPLFVALGGTAVWALADPPPGAAQLLAVLAPLPFAAILVVTAVGAVPQHRAFEPGWNAAAHRRLLLADSVRLVLAAASVALAAGLLAA